MKSANKILSESCITRILMHNKDHDCAMLTAFRQYDKKGNPRSKDQNNKANELLGKALRYLSYGITKVIGSYAEQQTGRRSMEENSWFVVNLNDDPKFISNIINFGIVHEQDSVLIIPKNGFFDVKTTYLYGTNEDNIDDFCFVKWQDKKFATDIKFSNDNDMLTKIKNKAFYFKFDEMINEHDAIFNNMSNKIEIVGRMKKIYPFMFKGINNEE